jgi:hypothetical protein
MATLHKFKLTIGGKTRSLCPICARVAVIKGFCNHCHADIGLYKRMENIENQLTQLIKEKNDEQSKTNGQ